MAIQSVNLGTAPTGVGGDTFRSAATKINANFADTTHAASRIVGLATGNLLEVGAYGLGRTTLTFGATLEDVTVCGFGYGSNTLFGQTAHSYISARGTRSFVIGAYANRLAFATRDVSGTYGTVYDVRSTANTTIDSNGFIKNASPIVQLFADKIELNDEAKLQDISFEKIGVGDYLIKGTTGFAKQGWYVETPKDANGNVLFSVVYEVLENSDISVKTYKKKFDLETASIVADLTKPIDITENRWIDIRLQELPQEIVADEPEQ